MLFAVGADDGRIKVVVVVVGRGSVLIVGGPALFGEVVVGNRIAQWSDWIELGPDLEAQLVVIVV